MRAVAVVAPSAWCRDSWQPETREKDRRQKTKGREKQGSRAIVHCQDRTRFLRPRSGFVLLAMVLSRCCCVVGFVCAWHLPIGRLKSVRSYSLSLSHRFARWLNHSPTRSPVHRFVVFCQQIRVTSVLPWTGKELSSNAPSMMPEGTDVNLVLTVFGLALPPKMSYPIVGLVAFFLLAKHQTNSEKCKRAGKERKKKRDNPPD